MFKRLKIAIFSVLAVFYVVFLIQNFVVSVKVDFFCLKFENINVHLFYLIFFVFGFVVSVLTGVLSSKRSPDASPKEGKNDPSKPFLRNG